MQSLLDRFERLMDGRGGRALLVLLGLGACLFLPFLGSFGLWDPPEVRIAEVAKEMAHTHTWNVPLRASGPRSLLLYWVLAAGYRVLGNSELAGRLPIALLSLAALAATFYAGIALLRRRGAFLGTFALLTSPVFFLGARQLTTHVAAILPAALAIGGLARAVWPSRENDPRLGQLFAGLLGLLLGFYASGILLGVAVPLTAVGVALVATSDGATARGVREARLARVVIPVAAAATAGLAVLAWWRGQPGGHPGYSPLLAGTPRPANHLVEATTLLRSVGFGAFPWIVLVPLAVARIFGSLGSMRPPSGDEDVEPAASARLDRDDFARLLLVAWVLVAYLTHTLYNASVNEPAHFSAFGAIALLAGDYLDELWSAPSPSRVAGVIALVGTAIVAHDSFMAPEHWAGAHVLDGLKWPTPGRLDRIFLGLRIPVGLGLAPDFILFISLSWGALLALGSAMRPRHADRGASLGGRKALLAASLVAALVGTAGTIYWLIPAVSQHLSLKGIFTKYKALVGTGNSEIGKYHVPGQLSDYGKTTELASLPQVFDFLGKRQRVFVISAADDLPAIDQYARSRAPEGRGPLPYFVVDDSNSKFLMISNQRGAEPDRNPLRRFVLPVDQPLPQRPQHEVAFDFDGKIELVGYDLPSEITRGAEFTLRLYYKVKQPLPAAYKVFVHFDGPGTRFNGDHVPLEGRFPTNYWVPGFYVIDEHKLVAQRALAPAGTYSIFTGFWLGEQRLKVVAGPQDGDQRAKLGTVRVQ